MLIKTLLLFTRTPLHIGAGGSVGAIDQPIQRERHTGFPFVSASALKGGFVDFFLESQPILDANGQPTGKRRLSRSTSGRWLFGPEPGEDDHFAGALQFGDARLLAFPVRSAKGSFAWITCPLILRRAAREGVIPRALVGTLQEVEDDKALFLTGDAASQVCLTRKQKQKIQENGREVEKEEIIHEVVLEEYTFRNSGGLPDLTTPTTPPTTQNLGQALALLFADDEVWREIAPRLVVLSDGMMSFFAQNACEIAQHVRISDETGTAEHGGLFNQENVPSETLFYSMLNVFGGRGAFAGKDEFKADQAFKKFSEELAAHSVCQFGGDATTGLGYCTIRIFTPLERTPATQIDGTSEKLPVQATPTPVSTPATPGGAQ